MAANHCRELSRAFSDRTRTSWLERDQGPLDALFHRAIRHTGIGLIHPHFRPSNPAALGTDRLDATLQDGRNLSLLGRHHRTAHSLCDPIKTNQMAGHFEHGPADIGWPPAQPAHWPSRP